MRHLSNGVLIVGAVLAVGCARLNHQDTVRVNVAEVQPVTLTPTRADQPIRIEVNASGSAVNVWVVAGKDKAAAMDRLVNYQKPENVLASKEKVQQDALEVTVPGKEPFTILLTTTGKDATVQLKVTGK